LIDAVEFPPRIGPHRTLVYYCSKPPHLSQKVPDTDPFGAVWGLLNCANYFNDLGGHGAAPTETHTSSDLRHESAAKFKSMVSPRDMSRKLILMDTRVVGKEGGKGQHSERS
jgi:hypothetical protein